LSERTASNFRVGSFTSAHLQALNILGLHDVHFLAEQVVPCFGEFDGKGRPVSYKVDILINDADYGTGVVEIDGDIHKKLKHELKDESRDAKLKNLGLWVEHIPNEEVAGIMQILEKHRRARDDHS